jgi:hypothetical protein
LGVVRVNRTGVVLRDLVGVEILDVRRLEEFDVVVVGPDDEDAVDVETHPHEIAESSKDDFQVYVITED